MSLNLLGCEESLRFIMLFVTYGPTSLTMTTKMAKIPMEWILSSLRKQQSRFGQAYSVL